MPAQRPLACAASIRLRTWQRLLTRATIAQGHNRHSSCYLPFAPRGLDALMREQEEDGQKDEWTDGHEKGSMGIGGVWSWA
jgi:hypothetical protein